MGGIEMKNQQRLPDSWKSRMTQEELTCFIQSCKVYKDKKALRLFWYERMQSLLTNNQSNARDGEDGKFHRQSLAILAEVSRGMENRKQSHKMKSVPNKVY